MSVSDHVSRANLMERGTQRRPAWPEFVSAAQKVRKDGFGFIAVRHLYREQPIPRRITIFEGAIFEGANIAGFKKVADAMPAFGGE